MGTFGHARHFYFLCTQIQETLVEVGMLIWGLGNWDLMLIANPLKGVSCGCA